VKSEKEGANDCIESRMKPTVKARNPHTVGPQRHI